MLEFNPNTAEANVSTEACSRRSALLVEPNNFTFLAVCVCLNQIDSRSHSFHLSKASIASIISTNSALNASRHSFWVSLVQKPFLIDPLTSAESLSSNL